VAHYIILIKKYLVIIKLSKIYQTIIIIYDLLWNLQTNS